MHLASHVYSTMQPAQGVERNDCSVRAFAIAAGVPYGVAHDIHAIHGREWGRGTPWMTITLVAAHFKAAPVALPRKTRSGRLPPPTLAEFIRTHPRGRYWVCRLGHAFAVINGVVHDWQKGTGPRSRVLAAYRMPEE